VGALKGGEELEREGWAMKPGKAGESSVAHDAAVAAAAVVMDELFPHCPNGMAGAIHERLSEIIEAAIEAAEVTTVRHRMKPSKN
jgi:hypothetical protein